MRKSALSLDLGKADAPKHGHTLLPQGGLEGQAHLKKFLERAQAPPRGEKNWMLVPCFVVFLGQGSRAPPRGRPSVCDASRDLQRLAPHPRL